MQYKVLHSLTTADKVGICITLFLALCVFSIVFGMFVAETRLVAYVPPMY